MPTLNVHGMTDNVTSERCHDNGAMTTQQQQHQQQQTMTEVKPATLAAYYQQTQCVPLYTQHYSKLSTFKNCFLLLNGILN